MITQVCSCDRFESQSRLCYCPECNALRCTSCLQPEFIVYYCPNCLFEVPSATARSDKLYCARSCCLCPVCEATCTVTPVSPSDHLETALDSSASGTGSGYILKCPACEWDSCKVTVKSDGSPLVFEKATSIARSVATMLETQSNDHVDYERIVSQFSHLFSGNTASNHHAKLAMSPVYADGSLFRKLLNVKDDGQPEEISNLNNFEATTGQPEISSSSDSPAPGIELSQRLGQVYIPDTSVCQSDLMPRPVRLVARMGYRCSGCDHALVKPEPKAQSLKFKIKQMALDYLPLLQIVPVPEDKTLPNIIVKLSNLTNEPCKVTIYRQQNEQPVDDEQKVVLCSFILPGKQEFQDVDAEQLALASTSVQLALLDHNLSSGDKLETPGYTFGAALNVIGVVLDLPASGSEKVVRAEITRNCNSNDVEGSSGSVPPIPVTWKLSFE